MPNLLIKMGFINGEDDMTVSAAKSLEDILMKHSMQHLLPQAGKNLEWQ